MRFNVDHIQDAAIANGIVWNYECILGRCPKLKLCNIFYMHIWIFAMCLFGTRLAIFAFRLRVTWDDISIRAGTDVYIFASPSCRTSRGQWDMNTCGMVMMLFIEKNWSTPIHQCDHISIYFLFGLEKLLCRSSFEELSSYEALLENRTLEIRAEIVTIQKGIGNVSKLNQIFWSPHGFWIRSIRSTPHKNEKWIDPKSIEDKKYLLKSDVINIASQTKQVSYLACALLNH